MTQLRVLSIVVFVLLSAYGHQRSSAEELAHIVFFTLAENTSENQDALIAGCNQYLSRHAGTTHFSVGAIADELQRDVNDRDFSVALHLVFKDKASHDRYQEHPRHLKFIEEYKHLWSQVRVFDSYIKISAVDQLLARKTTLTFSQEALGFALRKLEDAANHGARDKLVIKIDRDSLQRDGITTNQRILDFDMKDRSVEDILNEIVGRANPQRGVPLGDRRQRLVWVIDGGSVLITTRWRADQETWVLPEVFRVR